MLVLANMKVIRKSEVKKHQNSASCTAFEYPIGDTDINGAVIAINGRYPDEGRVVNQVCKEMAYVIKGEGIVQIEGSVVELSEGDLVLIQPGERYYWEGKLTMFVPCTPAWYPEQHKEVK